METKVNVEIMVTMEPKVQQETKGRKVTRVTKE